MKHLLEDSPTGDFLRTKKSQGDFPAKLQLSPMLLNKISKQYTPTERVDSMFYFNV